MRLVYSTLFVLLLPLLCVRLLWRSRLAPDYRRRLLERMGRFPERADGRPLIWVHAVSLGETLAARPLLERILTDFPDHALLVTTTTPTGSQQVTRLFADRVLHVYAPWDTPGSVQRFLRRMRPALLVLMETELWPNMLHYAKRGGCRILLANARLSERSARGYARFANTTRAMLGNLHGIAAQGHDDARRFVELGMDPARVSVSGSIKYEVNLDAAMRERAGQLRLRWGLAERPVLIAASTHEGEEELLLAAFAGLRRHLPEALLLLAPRHPERFEVVYGLCSAAGLRVARRSEDAAVSADTELLLIDTLGELLLLFGVADVAVIGGSFFDRGGHNPLEAAAWGCPVVCGESMYNFSDVTRRLTAEGGLLQTAGSEELCAALLLLLTDAHSRRRRGAAALRVIDENRGALDAQLAAIRALLYDSALPGSAGAGNR